MLRVSVPTLRKLETDHDKSYTVYCIQVSMAGRTHTVEKRYSECEELHKQLKKVIATPEFPPKKVLKWNPRVLEQRRHGLETYLQAVVHQGNHPQILYAFLELPDRYRSSSVNSVDQIGDDIPATTHQPVLVFKEDPYVHDSYTKGGLPDIVVHGVSMGLYHSADEVR